MLCDGDVITGMKKGVGSFAKIQVESLFRDEAYWDYPGNMLRFTYREAVCVLHRNRRYLLPHYHHYDQNLVCLPKPEIGSALHSDVFLSHT